MAVLFLESFDHYAPLAILGAACNTTGLAPLLTKWTGLINSGGGSSCYVGPAAARDGIGNGLQFNDNSSSVKMYKTIAASQDLVLGAAVYWKDGVPTNGATLGFFDSGTEQISVRGDGAGHLTVSRNGTVIGTSTLTVSSATWYYVELKVHIAGSTSGTFDLHVNGVSWVSSAGTNTQASSNASANQFIISDNGGNATNVWFDDIYVLNTSGTNTDFLGPIKVGLLVPVGAGYHTDWTPNGSTNAGAVGEVAPNGDTTFNQSSTANQIDTFQMSTLPAASGSVFAVQHVLYARQDAGAARSIAPLQRSGSTDYAGTAVNLASTYAYYLEVHDTDPSTGPAAWTVSSLAAAQMGYKEIS